MLHRSLGDGGAEPMMLSIHQPAYFPWLGLLDKIAQCDTHLVMDEVQLSDTAYQHRNLFLTAEGKVKFLTIPFNRKNYLHRSFKDLEIADPTWSTRHLDFLANSYGKHPYFLDIMPAVEGVLRAPRTRLLEVLLDSMALSMKLLGITAKVILQSELEYDRSARRGDLVLALIKAAGADTYLSGRGARAYLDEGAFGPRLKLKYNDFTHPVYEQKNTAAFIPGLSSLDLLFNHGIPGSRQRFARGPR